MKSVRVSAAFGVLVFACIGILWTLGILSAEAAGEISFKALGVVAILLLATITFSFVLKSSKSPDAPKDTGGGPRF